MKLVFDSDDLKTLPISVDPEVMSGAPVFKGTRVPIDALFGNLAHGVSLEEFLENFPTVKRKDAQRLIEFAKRSLMALSVAP
jgi:uncharacterized protein (DUF433 family)